MTADTERIEQKATKRQKRDVSAHDEDDEGPIEADFLFNDPEPEDYDGIIAIIQGYLKKVPWKQPTECQDSCYGLLARLISEQPNLGTLIKTDNDSDDGDGFVMAVMSILNLRMYKHLESFEESIMALTEQHGSAEDLRTIRSIFSDKNNQIGLIVNERLGNIPIELVGSLHQCVYDDIKWSVENADNDEERAYYKFTHLVSISRLFTENVNSFDENNTAYINPEERFYCEEALLKFMWYTGESGKVDFFENDQTSAKSKVVPEVMLLYCIKFDRFSSIVKRISSTFV